MPKRGRPNARRNESRQFLGRPIASKPVVGLLLLRLVVHAGYECFISPPSSPARRLHRAPRRGGPDVRTTRPSATFSESDRNIKTGKVPKLPSICPRPLATLEGAPPSLVLREGSASCLGEFGLRNPEPEGMRGRCRCASSNALYSRLPTRRFATQYSQKIVAFLLAVIAALSRTIDNGPVFETRQRNGCPV